MRTGIRAVAAGAVGLDCEIRQRLLQIWMKWADSMMLWRVQGKYCPFCVQIYREKDPDSFDGKEVRPLCM